MNWIILLWYKIYFFSGQMMVIAPCCYHFVVNTGHKITTSMNFALKDWVEYVKYFQPTSRALNSSQLYIEMGEESRWAMEKQIRHNNFENGLL